MRVADASNPQLVTIAVALLGGEVTFVDREDVAIKVNEIAPGRFSWRKYPEQIDLTTVHFALQDAAKAKHGSLLVGDMKRGWMLSPSGLKWLKTVELETLLNDETIAQRRSSVSARQEEERTRLYATKAYELFINGNIDGISLHDFYQFARINEYFQTKARLKRYAIIDNAVAPSTDLTKLWELLKEKFHQEMT